MDKNQLIQELIKKVAQEEAVDTVIHEIQGNLNHLIQRVEKHLLELSRKDITEYQVMRIKRQILLDWSSVLPLGPVHCYFCMKKNEDEDRYFNNYCNNGKCEYRMLKGDCCKDKDSAYSVISIFRDKLGIAIADRYWMSEFFDEEPEEDVS